MSPRTEEKSEITSYTHYSEKLYMKTK